MIIEGNILRPSGETEVSTYDTNSEPTTYPNVYLTDGNGTFATEVWLGCYDSPERWRDATQGEYDEYITMMEEERQKQMEQDNTAPQHIQQPSVEPEEPEESIESEEIDNLDNLE